MVLDEKVNWKAGLKCLKSKLLRELLNDFLNSKKDTVCIRLLWKLGVTVSFTSIQNFVCLYTCGGTASCH